MYIKWYLININICDHVRAVACVRVVCVGLVLLSTSTEVSSTLVLLNACVLFSIHVQHVQMFHQSCLIILVLLYMFNIRIHVCVCTLVKMHVCIVKSYHSFSFVAMVTGPVCCWGCLVLWSYHLLWTAVHTCRVHMLLHYSRVTINLVLHHTNHYFPDENHISRLFGSNKHLVGIVY